MPVDERERVAVVCHSARISSENNFTVKKYVNQGHNTTISQRLLNINRNLIFSLLHRGSNVQIIEISHAYRNKFEYQDKSLR